MSKYKSEMNLQSESGYCMPFEQKQEGNNSAVTIIKPYGLQNNGKKGEGVKNADFFHGVIFKTSNYTVAACADGRVIDTGNDAEIDDYIVIRYDKYDVKYGYLSSLEKTYGENVVACDVVGITSDKLYMSVTYDGIEIDPVQFLTMLYANLKEASLSGKFGKMEIPTFDFEIKTKYEDNREEIEDLLHRYFQPYFNDMLTGKYSIPEQTGQSLKNAFSIGQMRNYFFQSIPSFANPFGFTENAVPLISRIINILIGDFLNYLALCHNVYPSGTSSDEKKKRNNRQ